MVRELPGTLRTDARILSRARIQTPELRIDITSNHHSTVRIIIFRNRKATLGNSIVYTLHSVVDGLRFLEISNHVWNNQFQFIGIVNFTDRLGRVLPNRSRIQKSDSGSFQSPNGFLNSRMIMIETIRHANLAPGILARSIDFCDTGQGES